MVFDPYQMVSSAQRLKGAGLPMMEFPETLDRLTAMTSNLYGIIKDRNLAVYPSDELRLAIARAVAIETPRGTRIGKHERSHKIDLVIALGMAALVASQGGPETPIRRGTLRSPRVVRASRSGVGSGSEQQYRSPWDPTPPPRRAA